MARIANVDIPDNKRVEFALLNIYGIGRTRARIIAERSGAVDNPKVRDLNEGQLARIREIVDHDYLVEGELRREVNENLRRLVDIGAYRGVRHRRGLPSHGQRTRTNARTKRGGKRTVAGKRRTLAKK